MCGERSCSADSSGCSASAEDLEAPNSQWEDCMVDTSAVLMFAHPMVENSWMAIGGIALTAAESSGVETEWWQSEGRLGRDH